MEEIPSFAKWLQNDIENSLQQKILVSKEVKDLSKLLSLGV